MNLTRLLTEEAEMILVEATAALGQNHHSPAGTAGRQRLRALYALVLQSVQQGDVATMSTYADKVAQQRFLAGSDLDEAQTTFNVLEASIWQHVVASVPAAELPEAISQVNATLNAGKDALARAYVTLARQNRTPCLNIPLLFSGTDAVLMEA
ncbi:MAG: hypothetical protein AB1791_00455 [Chloroflexota bacterium]